MYLAAASQFPESLYIATLAIFGALVPPTLWVWRKHGRPGFLGYNYVWAICAIRVAGGGLSIAAINKSNLEEAATIVNAMAISPLILAALGVHSEARKARSLSNWRLDHLNVFLVHGLVIAAIVMICLGIVHTVEGKSTSNDGVLIKTGLAMLIIAYAIICLGVFHSLRQGTNPRSDAVSDGSKLMYGVLLTLPFIGFRLVYGVLAFLLTDPSFADSLAARVVLGLIPEIIATTVFIAAGIATRNMWKPVPRSQKV